MTLIERRLLKRFRSWRLYLETITAYKSEKSPSYLSSLYSLSYLAEI